MLHSRNRSRQPRRGRRNRGLHLEQSASLAVSELNLPFWREDSDEVAILRIVFPNARQRVYRAEWMLARDNDVAVRCKSQIERTQFGIRHQTRELRGRASAEGHYGVIALAVGADSRGEEKPAIIAESKPSRKRYDFGW